MRATKSCYGERLCYRSLLLAQNKGPQIEFLGPFQKPPHHEFLKGVRNKQFFFNHSAFHSSSEDLNHSYMP